MNAGIIGRAARALVAILLVAGLMVGLYAAAIQVAVYYVFAQTEPFADVRLSRGQVKAEVVRILDAAYARKAEPPVLTTDQAVYIDGEHQLTLTFEDDRLVSWSVSGPLIIRRVETSGEFNLCCGEAREPFPASDE